MKMYHYPAKVKRVVDGDTVDLLVDLGFNVMISERFRLYGLNAPEVRGKERKDGLASAAILRGWCKGKDIIVETLKDKKGKYGRYIAILWLDEVSLNERLINEGYAVKCEY